MINVENGGDRDLQSSNAIMLYDVGITMETVKERRYTVLSKVGVVLDNAIMCLSHNS